MKPDDSWLVSILYEGRVMRNKDHPPDNQMSTLVMRSLLFLKREQPQLKCGIIYGNHETLREAFENGGLPQSIYITNGKPYYMSIDAKLVHHLIEFMERYEELQLYTYYSELSLPREGFLIYPEYWVKALGSWWK